jgi:DNA-directed RNA polymerase subunit M/transcription elongation factor TFIIS
MIIIKPSGIYEMIKCPSCKSLLEFSNKDIKDNKYVVCKDCGEKIRVNEICRYN